MNKKEVRDPLFTLRRRDYSLNSNEKVKTESSL